MQDERDDREDEQEVNQPARNMEYRESADPCDQQDDEKDCPDTHRLLRPALEQKTPDRPKCVQSIRKPIVARLRCQYGASCKL